MVLAKKWGILIKKESESLVFTGLEIPRDYRFMREDEKDYMPHGVTENEFLERLDPKELEDIQQNIVYSMIRRKTFDNARVLKKWQVIVDATELDEGYQKKNEHYLSRCYNRG